ncbi:hypothetical protein [Kumtagia ephedrae]|uniref:Uncharacterized protein n=1 Tax=Kumtagia ephedrae TaxID=2116701 RepID=A0A2P7RXA9_9HYPH|nr:hypothetical protein [Mesorhizobium ephedrae]PSJ54858.1 hypothetical protein C7I84_23930 [Mesorhizobium ephedrae]
MFDLAPVLRHFAGHEFEIRRRCASDPAFSAICEDYAAAATALERWKGDRRKAQDYRQLLLELEDEIREHLRKPMGSTARSD